MTVYLEGLSIQFYRGIGSNAQRMFPFKQFNFFIGANNTGKSTVLNFLTEVLSPEINQRGGNRVINNPVNQHRGKTTGTMNFGLIIGRDTFLSSIRTYFSDRNIESAMHIVERIVDLISTSDHVELRYDSSVPTFVTATKLNIDDAAEQITHNGWKSAWSLLNRSSGGGIRQHVTESVNALVKAQNLSVPEIKIIPALRQVGKDKSASFDFSGQGIIGRLAQLQNPDHDRQDDRRLFAAINEFLRDVTDKPEAAIEIPFNRDHILVHMDNKVLPLESLGMGIHEVIMMATLCTMTKDSIVCIEEPEIHLHPILQRKFVRYLSLNTNNQYFIATHSAAFIDTLGAAIFHVHNDGDQTYVKESVLRKDRHRLCIDLGYKASDIVQSNCVIWVEGPSDRIYLFHWIRRVAPDLIEGIHYSIMFYGGRLLSHLSADSEEVSEFIDLKSLNRNCAIVIDSDRKHERDSINATKKRIKQEFSRDRGVCWITQGREIENYVPFSLLQTAVAATHPKLYHDAANAGLRFDHALHFKAKGKGRSSFRLIETADKVKVARAVCGMNPEMDQLDLLSRVREVVEMIRRANH